MVTPIVKPHKIVFLEDYFDSWGIQASQSVYWGSRNPLTNEESKTPHRHLIVSA